MNNRNGQFFPLINHYWPYRGEMIDDLLKAHPEKAAMPPPATDEIIARVEAASICSSDVKVIRMGRDHPLFAADNMDTVLGHEMCLRVVMVGEGQQNRFRVGQRLALQPSLMVAGKRSIVGMDRPGGFSQYIRLDSAALDAHVMEVPEDICAASIALLEPYGCVERAWNVNVRQQLKAGGRALIVCVKDADFTLSPLPDWREIVLVGERPSFLLDRAVKHLANLDVVEGKFDDILVLGSLCATQLNTLCTMMAKGAVLLQGRKDGMSQQVALDPARIHYDEVALIGTRQRDLTTAFADNVQRFDVRRDGVALIHGAGGAMGRIHVHRLLQLPNGPKIVIASSRNRQRLDDLEADFEALARLNNVKLVVTSTQDLAAKIVQYAPGGLDDVVVVAPDPVAIANVTDWLAPDGLLAVFAGFPYGEKLDFDLASIALTGKRITGSSGCSLEDMKNVLDRVVNGSLELSANIAAVAGLNALPIALKAVADGAVSGKIIIYPHKMDLPLTPVKNWTRRDELELTG